MWSQGSEDEYDKVASGGETLRSAFPGITVHNNPRHALQDSASPAYIDCHSYHYSASGTDSVECSIPWEERWLINC